MQANADTSAPERPAAPVELVIDAGRLKGTRRALSAPVTVIGRAEGCDLRLNAEGVEGLQCVLARGAEGLSLRVLPGGGSTLINGVAARDGILNDGDRLSVGPFHFRVRMPGSVAGDRDALRVQAAAVAAQQAALEEMEDRLEQRRLTLEQQEEQLAAHLEVKRQRLGELRDQTRAAYEVLKTERAAHDEQTAETVRGLDLARREVADGREQMHVDRKRLGDLRRRLKQRWHRQWAGERAAARQRDEDLARRLREVEAERAALQAARQQLAAERLAFSGDMELGRRQLQAKYEELRQARRAEVNRWAAKREEVARQRAALDLRDISLAEAERELTADHHRWQHARRHLEAEVEGLDNRARNYRRKIFDQEQEVRRLELVLGEHCAQARDGQTSGEPRPSLVAPPSVAATPPVPPIDAARETSLAELESMAGEVADQRLRLLEQAEWLTRTQEGWQRDRETMALELAGLANRLGGQARDLDRREQVIGAVEQRLRQQNRECSHLQRHLEGWQARMTAREAVWAGERDRLIADTQAREQGAEQRWSAVEELRQRWAKRRRRESEWLRAERSACEKLRREGTALRDQWLALSASVEQERRGLAERSLALEQFQQELQGQASDASAAAKRIDRLRRRWASLSATDRKTLAERRAALAAESGQLEEQLQRLHKQTARLAAQQEELAAERETVEGERAQAAEEMVHMRRQLAVLHTHRDRYERQANALNDEVERLARLLLDEAEILPLPIAQAA